MTAPSLGPDQARQPRGALTRRLYLGSKPHTPCSVHEPRSLYWGFLAPLSGFKASRGWGRAVTSPPAQGLPIPSPPDSSPSLKRVLAGLGSPPSLLRPWVSGRTPPQAPHGGTGPTRRGWPGRESEREGQGQAKKVPQSSHTQEGAGRLVRDGQQGLRSGNTQGLTQGLSSSAHSHVMRRICTPPPRWCFHPPGHWQHLEVRGVVAAGDKEWTAGFPGCGARMCCRPLPRRPGTGHSSTQSPYICPLQVLLKVGPARLWDTWPF